MINFDFFIDNTGLELHYLQKNGLSLSKTKQRKKISNKKNKNIKNGIEIFYSHSHWVQIVNKIQLN